MKKILIILCLLLSFSILTGCNSDADTDSDTTIDSNPIVTAPKDDSFKQEIVYQSIELSKNVYELNEDLVITVNGAANNDFVGVFDMQGEPGGKGTSHYKRTKVNDLTEIVFNISDMKLTPGEYCVCLYQYGTMFLYDRVEFKVSDGDATNYQVQKAEFIFTNNNNSRTSRLKLTPSTDKEITYKFYWAKDGQRLDYYSAIDTVVKASLDEFTVKFKDNMYMPKEANQVEVYVLNGTSPSYFVDVDNAFSLNDSNYLFSFQVFSDIHSDVAQISWNSHFKKALIDVTNLKKESTAIIAVGDLTNFGSQTCYELLEETLDEYLGNTNIKFYSALGNHEYQYYVNKSFDVARDYFFEMRDLDSIYYSFVLNGMKFIILGSETLDKAGYMSDEQLNWFKNEIASVDKNTPTFIFFHQPLGNTVSGMDSGLEAAGYKNVNDELRNTLKNYPNAYVFTGHTHMTYETNKTAVFGQGIDANFINTGAIAYLNDINYNEICGSLGLFIEVYEDYIMINGRNFYTGKWVAEGSFVSPIYKVN